MEEKKLYFKAILCELNSVDYEKGISIDKNFDGPIKTITRDSYKVVNYSARGFDIVFERKVELDPKVLFSMSVKYDVSFLFSDDTIKEYENKLDDLKALIDVKLEKAINVSGVVAKASALVSSVTIQNYGNPVITQPRVIIDKMWWLLNNIYIY